LKGGWIAVLGCSGNNYPSEEHQNHKFKRQEMLRKYYHLGLDVITSEIVLPYCNCSISTQTLDELASEDCDE